MDCQSMPAIRQALGKCQNPQGLVARLFGDAQLDTKASSMKRQSEQEAVFVTV